MSDVLLLTEGNKSDFQHALLKWYKLEGRNFPWRDQATPYRVLVAEKLLQQTVARTVTVRAYHQLLEAYPTPEHLSEASVSDLEDIIRPLGFTYRAKELIGMARVLVDQHGWQVPHNLKDLLALPGVGDYSARAVLCFAFGEDVPIVDTNVARWLYRLFGIRGALPANPARKRSLRDLAGSLVPENTAREFNFAILDLCALVCKPSTPECPICPVQAFCIYGAGRGNIIQATCNSPGPTIA